MSWLRAPIYRWRRSYCGLPRIACQATLTRVSVVSAGSLSSDPLNALRELAEGEAELDRLRRVAVRRARAAGVTWDQIGEALGMTRQSAWEYFSRDVRGALARNADANTDLDEAEALELAVKEVRAVRRARRAR
jgi:hypothetical protein